MGGGIYRLQGRGNGGRLREPLPPARSHRSRRITMRSFVLRTATIAGAIVVAAGVEYAPITPTAEMATQAPTAGSPTLQVVATPADAKSYVINFTGSQLPADLAAQLSAAGGTVTRTVDQIGVAVAASSDPRFAARAAKINGVADVTEDIDVQWVAPERIVDAGDFGPAASFGATEAFRQIQWAPDAISAPAAWDLGARGAGARVAIVDGGIHSTHQDIAPNLDVAHSRSFVTGRAFNFDQARDTLGVCRLNDTFWHGTHVAGIVGAPGQGLGTVGIAPSATLIGVKVLHCGTGWRLCVARRGPLHEASESQRLSHTPVLGVRPRSRAAARGRERHKLVRMGRWHEHGYAGGIGRRRIDHWKVWPHRTGRSRAASASVSGRSRQTW